MHYKQSTSQSNYLSDCNKIPSSSHSGKQNYEASQKHLLKSYSNSLLRMAQFQFNWFIA